MVTLQHVQDDDYTFSMPGEVDNRIQTARGSQFARNRMRAYVGGVEFKPHSSYYSGEIYRAYHLHNGGAAALYIGIFSPEMSSFFCAENLSGIRETMKNGIRQWEQSMEDEDNAD